MNIEKAIRIATEAHAGQKDKGGQPYILHCLRVMIQMDTEEEMIIAVLHDTIEDTNYTLLQLQKDSGSVIEYNSIKRLTRKNHENYENYIKNIKESKLATKVKLADLKDNIDLTRIPNPTIEDISRVLKYINAYNYLIK